MESKNFIENPVSQNYFFKDSDFLREWLTKMSKPSHK